MGNRPSSSGSGGLETSQSDQFDPDMENRIWRKLDLYILPVVCMFYFLSWLDRSNIGNARVAGLQKDLMITNRQYSIALTMTYLPYIAVELPSNLILKFVGPNLMLPTMVTLWGVVTALQGVVSTYSGLLACRFFLGLLEGGLLPGLILYLSFFYPRQLMNLRVTAFSSASSLTGAFSGLLSFAIVHMNGIGHKRGWAWIFILQGLFTFLCGILSFFFLPRSPVHAYFLTTKEKDYIASRLEKDGSKTKDEKSDNFSWREVGKTFTLPHFWILNIIFFMFGNILFGLAYFTPSIVQDLGYNSTQTQLMTVPPFVVAFFLSLCLSYVSDRYYCRGLVSIFGLILCVIGFAMYLVSDNNRVQYSSLFFAISGTYVSAPTLATWNANNAAPHTRRAAAVAVGAMITNSGGILATWLLGWISPGPRYTLATKILLSFSAFMVALVILNTVYLWNENRKKAEIRRSSDVVDEKPGLGNNSAWFIYSL